MLDICLSSEVDLISCMVHSFCRQAASCLYINRLFILRLVAKVGIEHGPLNTKLI